MLLSEHLSMSNLERQSILWGAIRCCLTNTVALAATACRRRHCRLVAGAAQAYAVVIVGRGSLRLLRERRHAATAPALRCFGF